MAALLVNKASTVAPCRGHCTRKGSASGGVGESLVLIQRSKVQLHRDLDELWLTNLLLQQQQQPGSGMLMGGRLPAC